ncbi:hypothetical protein GJV26_02385 [Massilia dura]|uniref:Uncharacterized protein n=1 Tax=Pseudoduganella dura TaxID=321982 RepID=A0A6I3X9Q0_9BURK|nr:hypothetical protein [Pseudoduganella dura]MUI11340.1 hypothetical protein [Pseudoduganella dura]
MKSTVTVLSLPQNNTPDYRNRLLQPDDFQFFLETYFSSHIRTVVPKNDHYDELGTVENVGLYSKIEGVPTVVPHALPSSRLNSLTKEPP